MAAVAAPCSRLADMALSPPCTPFAPKATAATAPIRTALLKALTEVFTELQGGWEPPSSNPGTAFRFTPGAPEATLYTFCALANCVDGLFPNSLIEGWDGSFHGTTAGGGGESFQVLETGIDAIVHGQRLGAPS